MNVVEKNEFWKKLGVENPNLHVSSRDKDSILFLSEDEIAERYKKSHGEMNLTLDFPHEAVFLGTI